MNTPNKYIREQYLLLLQSAYLNAYDERVPIDVTPPNPYIIISTQTRVETNRNKCDRQWDVTTQVDLYYRQQRGVNNTAVLDDLEDLIIGLISPDVHTDIDLSPYFVVYNTFVEQPIDIPQETQNETVLHRALRFRHIIGEAPDPNKMVVKWRFFTSDPYAAIAAGNAPNMSYFVALDVRADNYALQFNSEANGSYVVIAESANTTPKATWFSSIFNYGTIPDQIFRQPIVVEGIRYYISRTNSFYLEQSKELITLSA